MEFILCPTCKGEGEIEGKICSTCKGRGVYAWFGGYLLFWEYAFERGEVFVRKLKKVLGIIFGMVLIVFGLLGLISLVRVVFPLKELARYWIWFSLDRETLLLVFWVSILTDLYFYYTRARSSEEKRKIWPATLRQSPQVSSSWEETVRLPRALKINVVDAFRDDSNKLIYEARKLSRKLGHRKITSVHVLAGALQVSDVILAINRLGLDWKKLTAGITRTLAKVAPEEVPGNTFCSGEVKKVFLYSYGLAGNKRRLALGPLEILEALLAFEGPVKEIFYDLEVGPEEIKNVCLWIDTYEEIRAGAAHFRARARFKPKGGMSRAYTAIATPYLDTYSQDLTEIARSGYLPPCMDREKEIEQIFRILEGGGRGVLLVGQPGVGKTSIINGIARRMVIEDVPEVLQDKRLVSLNLSNLVAGAARPGEVEQRLQIIMNEAARSGNIMFFIRGIHNMIGVRTTEGELDISEILADAMGQRLFFSLATSIPGEYRRLIEGKTIAEAFQKVDIGEPEKNATIQILEAKAASIEAREQVYFSYPALASAVELSIRYLHERFLPEKAIHLLEEAAIYVRNKRGRKTIVQAEDIAELVAKMTSIPVTKITEKESEKLLHLEEQIHTRIIDQDEAVSMVAHALRRARVALRSAKRPIANLLFLGPTGVGKTELAKTVADIYFGGEDKMIRLDMSEYQEKASLSRLIGSPQSGGQLTDKVRQAPFSLLLLDEIEKAHPDILNIFLQVMDDGRLTDGQGRTVNFTNIILIGTSNAGTRFIQEEIRKGTPVKTIQEVLIQEKLKPYFRPEFLNRFDGVIVFKPLTKKEIAQIARLLLAELAKQLEGKGITLKVTDEAVLELAEAGFDPTLGARPLRRVIQEKVNDVLAKFLLTGKLGRRDVVILEKRGKIRVEKASE